ncbi:MAG: hypothetical protein ACYC3I_09690 [Gemmataceae bacterium]
MYKLTSLALLLALVFGLAAADTPAPAPVVQTEAGKKALAKIRQLGGLALELAQNDAHLEVSYNQTDGTFTDEHLAALKDLKGLVHLDLRAQPVTDAQLVHLKPLTELTHLHLEKSKITDKGLAELKGLVNLEYLNLHSTAVSDAGLTNLEGMKKLKKLYVWQTKVTEAGAAQLKKAIPGLDVNLGFKEEAEPKKIANKPEPKKEEAKAVAKKDDTKDKKQNEVKETKPAIDMTALLKARVAAAEKAYRGEFEGLRKTRRFGNILVQVTDNPENVYVWSVRWLQAQRELSPKHEDHVAALEAHLKRMTDLHAEIKTLSADLMPRFKVDEAEWYRLEAELWLAKAKKDDKKPEPKKDEKKKP